MEQGPDEVRRLGAAAFATMGVMALAAPGLIPRMMGLTIEKSTGRNEVRAVYGGFGLVTAASLVTGGDDARRHAARAAGLSLLGMAAGRALDVALTKELPAVGLLAAAGETALGTALLRSSVGRP